MSDLDDLCKSIMVEAAEILRGDLISGDAEVYHGDNNLLPIYPRHTLINGSVEEAVAYSIKIENIFYYMVIDSNLDVWLCGIAPYHNFNIKDPHFTPRLIADKVQEIRSNRKRHGIPASGNSDWPGRPLIKSFCRHKLED